MQSGTRVTAIIQARNEEQAIGNVLRQLRRAGVQRVAVVVNGSTDRTADTARTWAERLFPAFRIEEVPLALGPDVPRAYGTLLALREAIPDEWFVYVDGDWKGSFGPMLADTAATEISLEADLWWPAASPPSLYGPDVEERFDLILWQKALSLQFPTLVDATPSEGPLWVHSRVFSAVSVYSLYHPGLWFAESVRNPHLQVGLYRNWNQKIIGNPTRSALHAREMRETLIGDALEGCRVILNQKPSRSWRGRWYDGYHSRRRTEWLEVWLGRW